MSQHELPFTWTPPTATVLPFPASRRTGHAARVARNLARARTNKESNLVLSRAVDAFRNQMANAGFAQADVDEQLAAYLLVIHNTCHRIRSQWAPVLDDGMGRGGAA